MTEELKDTEPKEKVVELGEWFVPFENFQNIPYKYDRNDHKAKMVQFQVSELGSFEVSANWPFYGLFTIKTGVVILLSGEDEIKNFAEYERKFGSLLFDIGVHCKEKEFAGQNIPYQIELKGPSGNVFVSPFELTGKEIDTPMALNWHKNREGVEMLFISEKLLEKIQMRIVPTEENKSPNNLYPQV